MKNVVGFFAFLFVVGLIMEHWRVLLGVIVLVAIVAAAIPLADRSYKLARTAWERSREERRDRIARERAERSRLAARADEQHTQYLNGDARGIYGEFPPDDLG